MARYIGVQHRIKKTAKGESRPTIVTIVTDKGLQTLELTTEYNEAKFAHENLMPGDQIAVIMGGSGGRFIAGLARKGENIGAKVFGVPSTRFAEIYGKNRDKSKDSESLAELLSQFPEVFYPIRTRDRQIIILREMRNLLDEVMTQRIACGQRVRQNAYGKIFFESDDLYPEGKIEQEIKAELANDPIYQAFVKEEKIRKAQVKDACEGLDIYDILVSVEGCGPAVASRLIAEIQDIRKFYSPPDPDTMAFLKTESLNLEKEANLESDISHIKDRITPSMPHFQVVQMVRSWKQEHGKEKEAELLDKSLEIHRQRHRLRQDALNKGKAKLRSYCGVGVKDGKFPRRKRGEPANWSNKARLALYLLGDQFNMKPDSLWGQKLREKKKRLRAAHPEVEIVNGKKRYADGHIQKMALWWIRGKFVEWLFGQWWKLESGS